MSTPNTSEKSVDLDRQENLTKGTVSVKKVGLYSYDSGTDTLIPINEDNPFPTSSSGAATSAKQDTIIANQTNGTQIANPTVYGTRIDEASATVTYIGDAVPGTLTSATSWRIKKVDTSSGTAITFADGVATFTKEWDERATYSYS